LRTLLQQLLNRHVSISYLSWRQISI
jgi:hypothetical protein